MFNQTFLELKSTFLSLYMLHEGNFPRYMGNGKESDPTDASAHTSANALVDSRPTVGRQSADCRSIVC